MNRVYKTDNYDKWCTFVGSVTDEKITGKHNLIFKGIDLYITYGDSNPCICIAYNSNDHVCYKIECIFSGKFYNKLEKKLFFMAMELAYKKGLIEFKINTGGKK